MVIAPRGGLGWFKGHSHYLAVRNFDGTAQLTTDAISPASLQIRISSASIEETGADFTPQQKGIIKKELEDIVLETGKYPDITFRSNRVTGTLKNGAFEVKIAGDMTLHGVTRHVVIPASVTVEGDTLRAKGEFKLNRKKFGVNATDAFHGFVRVRHTLKFTFDIIAQRI
jgi:polyisoprenoid-binding protein YceI